MEQLDVHVLVECTGQPITGCWQYAPAPTGLRLICERAIVRRVAQSKQRECLQRPVQHHRPRRTLPPRGNHASRMTWPVMERAAGEARYRTTSATAWRSTYFVLSPIDRRLSPVRIAVGATALARTPRTLPS